MGEERRPLIPRFSVRSMLLATAAAAVIAFILSQASGGALWAAAASVGLAFVVLAFAIYVLLFAIAWLITGARQRSRTENPRPGQGSAVTDKVAANTVFLVACLFLASSDHDALAVSGGMMTLPADGGNSTGLRLTVDTRWIDASGYRPVRIELQSTGSPDTSDRTLTIRLRPHSHSSRDTIVVSQDVKIPAGGKAANAVISVPQLGPWVSFEMDVYENGRYIEPLSIGPSRVATTWSGTFEGDSQNPAVLEIGDPENAPLDALPSSDVMDFRNYFDYLPGALSLAPITRWIDLSGFDLVVTSQRELAEFVRSQPRLWQAIHDWVLAGGTIVVGAGDNWQTSGKIELELSIAKPDQAATEQSDHGDLPFRLRNCGLGTLVVVRSDAELFDQKFPWTRLRGMLGAGRWRWNDRWGLSMFNPNGQFNDFLVPGVTRAPVDAFRVLMALFVVAAGPVNWLVLRKLGRLNLLVLTVPVIAAIATVGFMAYALAADGIGLRLRARSVECIDQQNGDSACMSRLSYYAGMMAPGGLQFSGQTVVLPLEELPAYFSSANSPVRRLDWVEMSADRGRALQQRLSEGWLKTRAATQFVTARVAKTSAHLEVQPMGGRQMQVINQLGTGIGHLVVADESGSLYAGEDVAAGKTATLESVGLPQDERVARFIAVVEATRPRIPAEMAASSAEAGLFGLSAADQNIFGPGRVTRTAVSQKQDTSILEQTIEKALANVKNNRLPPRTYLAIVDSSPAMEMGSPDVREETSFHLIVGHW